MFLRHDHLPRPPRPHATSNSGPTAEAFDETRAGLDHLAFSVSAREELDGWAQRFSEAGDAAFSPAGIHELDPGATVLVFRDPDNIQLELFFDPSTTAQ